jgi:outer membrane lipoprotein-sorting protein
MRYLWWKRARYAAPAAVLVAIGGIALVPTLSGAAAPPTLPTLTPQQLVTDAIGAKVPGLSGTLTWRANLGLSDLSTVEAELGQSSAASASSGGGQSASGTSGFNLLSLLSGTYQINVWLGPQAEHLALSESPDQEVDLIRNANQVWLWDSSTDTVTHLVGNPAPAGAAEVPTSTVPPLTPQQVATRLLDHLSPTTTITAGPPLYVAGQPAYQLLLTPKSASGSTIGHIEIDVGADGALTGVPLQVAVYAAGETGAALQLGYTGQINLGLPAASELTFTPPPGAKVITRQFDGSHAGQAGTGSGQAATSGSAHGNLGLKALGSGWTVVFTGTDTQLTGTAAGAQLDGLTSVIEVGGQKARLFGTDLLNVLIMPTGTFYAGFVTPAVLEADAVADR